MHLKRFFPFDWILKESTDFSAFFLFGPRQTGKSTWIRDFFKSNAMLVNLLDADQFGELSRQPSLLRQRIMAKEQSPEWVVIDEIQKLPKVLDEVHLMLEETQIKFLLTGSSARKLRKQGVNLLGGRALDLRFHPLVFKELKEEFDLVKALSYGLIPSVYLAKKPQQRLSSYVHTYLQEEIAQEGHTRNLSNFSRFLDVAGLSHGQMINFSQISSDAGVVKTTVIEYFKILEDTLIAQKLPAFRETVKRKAIETAKFYFFDLGVARFLSGKKRSFENSLHEAGIEFESFIYQEIKTYLDYHLSECALSYWRSVSGFEVDFIIGDRSAIECKTTTLVQSRDLKGLKAFREEGIVKNYVLVCREQTARVVDGILIVPWQEFLEALWEGRWS